MQIIVDNYNYINQVIDSTINSMKIVLPNCITRQDLKAQSFYKICKKIGSFNSEKGSIAQFCCLVAKHAIIDFLKQVSACQYIKLRNVVLSDDPNICKIKEINFDSLVDTQDELNMFDLVAVEDIFEKTIVRLKPRERFVAIMVYRHGWNTKDIMVHYKLDAVKAKNLRSYMQKRFRENMQELKTEC